MNESFPGLIPVLNLNNTNINGGGNYSGCSSLDANADNELLRAQVSSLFKDTLDYQSSSQSIYQTLDASLAQHESNANELSLKKLWISTAILAVLSGLLLPTIFYLVILQSRKAKLLAARELSLNALKHRRVSTIAASSLASRSSSGSRRPGSSAVSSSRLPSARSSSFRSSQSSR